MRISIDNQTWWNTSDIRKLAKGALNSMGAANWPSYVIEVGYSKSYRTSGWGYFNRNHMRLGLPKIPFGERIAGLPAPDLMPDVQVIEAARVLEHEISHNQGVRHKDMKHTIRWTVQAVPWAKDMITNGYKLRREPEKKKDRSPGTKALHVQAKVKEIEAKLVKLKTQEKRLKTRLREWKRKARYYEKRNQTEGS